jgi:hypothetical protein
MLGNGCEVTLLEYLAAIHQLHCRGRDFGAMVLVVVAVYRPLQREHFQWREL